ncbi:hypothetical protein [Herbidospora daliensis]|uniref:hypothetical protein n=1 Tax=Herbidospora daliensis TaxID=295585 RepID=UPI00078176CD|nr:hypothetical protein [Herbidospora daliensis]
MVAAVTTTATDRQVMPFDLESTTPVHQVAVRRIADRRLIRSHLAEGTVRFGGGDYGDPASIHGGEMPGLRELERGYEHIGTSNRKDTLS